MLDERESMHTHSGARLLVIRRWLGLERGALAELLQVRDKTVETWESGHTTIPSGAWTEIDALVARMDQEIEQLLAAAAEADRDAFPVRIPRSRKGKAGGYELPPAWIQRVVAGAMLRDPRIVPVYPQDDKDG